MKEERENKRMVKIPSENGFTTSTQLLIIKSEKKSIYAPQKHLNLEEVSFPSNFWSAGTFLFLLQPKLMPK